MRTTAHTDIKCIGTYRIDTNHILFEAGIVGTNSPAVDFAFHLHVQHRAEVITASIKCFA